jgi:uncharacterized membrane protein YfcA
VCDRKGCFRSRQNLHEGARRFTHTFTPLKQTCVMTTDAGLFASGFILLFLSNALASSAGAGGGLLNVAIIHTLQGYDLKSSVVLSLAAIMGNTLSQFVVNSRTRHPECRTRMAIYWDMVAIMMPAELAGSNLGVVFSDSVPSTVSFICALIVLIIGGAFSAKKALHLYELENERAAKKAAVSGHSATVNPMTSAAATVVDESGSGNPSASTFSIEDSLSALSVGNGESLRKSEQSAVEIPWRMIGVLAAVWLCYMAIYIVMANIPGCSTSWGVTFSFIYVILAVVAPLLFRHLMNEQSSHPETVLPGDTQWGSASYSIPVVTFTIGVLTALLGFGGGELLGPYLLHNKVAPVVSTATSGMLSLLNTALNVIHYAVLGRVQFAPSAGMFALGAAAGLCGRLCSLVVVARYDRASVLVCAMVVLLGLSCVMYVIYLATEKSDFSVAGIC